MESGSTCLAVHRKVAVGVGLQETTTGRYVRTGIYVLSRLYLCGADTAYILLLKSIGSLLGSRCTVCAVLNESSSLLRALFSNAAVVVAQLATLLDYGILITRCITSKHKRLEPVHRNEHFVDKTCLPSPVSKTPEHQSTETFQRWRYPAFLVCSLLGRIS